MTIALILLALLLAALLGFGFYMAGYAMNGKRQTLDEARAWQEAHYDLSWYDALEKTDYTVESFDGYALHAQLVRNPAPSDRYVVVSHGYTDNRFGALKYARLYLALGFNAIIYDLRGHGEDEPTFCTYSIRESADLNALIADSRARYPNAEALGIHGESLGAATTAAVMKYRPPVDFAVCDCGFSEIESIMRAGLRRMRLPGALFGLAALCARLRYGYDIRQMRPIDSLPDNEVPMLFIHGAADSFIPPAHSEAMRAATKGYAELHLIPGASHAASVLTAPEEYLRILEQFLKLWV